MRLCSLGCLVQVLHRGLNPLLLGVSTYLLVQFGLKDHSCLGTFAAGDYFIALQSLNGDLLVGHGKAASA